MPAAIDCTWTNMRPIPARTDPVALLTARLPQGWIVEPTMDPTGNTGIVVFAEQETRASPTFFLYGDAGRMQVALIVDDEWRDRTVHADGNAAFAAIVEAISRGW
ncbi:MAG TPA: hypothetical protein VHB27_09115 [Rhodopila sp.]|uniref:hypothetical protein n=1 Tax=Rhodopila sp. TaxID=2480087 RepID=UPI002C075D09|nr:hypothetical protein [Rhodopila sp.]HVY15376.1 hypothetical protein [Rhodopila sp.]